MEKKVCEVCNKNKTALKCDMCKESSCKQCSEFIDEDCFEFVSLLPENLKNKTFCLNCYGSSVAEDMNMYKDLLEKAKNMDVYSKDQSSETRLIKRIEKPIKIEDCSDRDETLLRLAFLSAQKGFDTMVDVDIRYKKVGEGKAYRKLVWGGSAVPVDPSIRK